MTRDNGNKKHRTRNRRRNLSVDVNKRLSELYLEEHSATAIANKLLEEFGANAPSVRTVQAIVRDYRANEEGTAGIEPWSLSKAADGEEARLVLEVLDAVIEQTEGRRRTLTEGEAAWVLKLRRAAATLPQWDVYRLSRLYLQRVAAKEGTGDLDAYIAAEAWLPGKMGRYFALVALGWVPEPPWILLSDTLPSSPEKVRESWASYVLSMWQDGDASKIPFERRQEMAYEAVDSVFARYQESIEPPSKRFWRFFEAIAGSDQTRGARGLLDVVNATVIANPEAVTEVITGADVSRPRAEEICRAKLISAREAARKKMINAFFPAFIQPLLGIGNDYILYEDGVSAEEVVSQLQEREQARLAEED